MKKKAGIALGVLTAGALALTGCAPSGGGDNGGGGSNLVVANGSEPQNPLVPTNTNEVGGGRIIDSLFAGLVYYDAAGESHNEVAESFESNEDYTQWTITLEEGWEFSNGEPVTAESFVNAWEYGGNLENAQLGQYFFNNIQGYNEEEASPLTGLTVVDDTTFTVDLIDGDAEFPLRLGYSAYYPLPEVAFEDIDAYGEAPIGNGPYQLQDENAWEHDVQITLVPNESYEGEREPQNDGIVFSFLASLDAAYAQLQDGSLDVLDQFPDAALATFETDLGDRWVNQAAALNQTITIPSRLAHFDGEEGDLRRQAISHAINREEITEVIFQGTRSPAHNFASPAVAGYNPDVEGNEVLEYDADLAVELWAQADAIAPWTGSFAIAYNSDGPHQGWVEATLNSISNVLGIETEAVAYPTFAQLRSEVTGETIQTAFRTGWQADYPSQYNFLGPLFGTGAGSNDGKYSNPEFDSLIAQGSESTDEAAKYEFYDQAQTILLGDLPAIPLWDQNVSGGWSTNVENVEFGWNSVPLYYEITKG